MQEKMKMKQKESEKTCSYQMRNSSTVQIGGNGSQSSRAVPKILIWLILFVTVIYVFYTFKLLSTSRVCNSELFSTSRLHSSVRIRSGPNATVTSFTNLSRVPDHEVTVRRPQTLENSNETELRHVVFGIAASAKLWEKRKNYIKLWYKPKEMRGVVWLDNPVKANESEGLPQVRISADTSKFAYTNKQGHRSAIRISRIVSETLQLGLEDVRWFVMGDDDTVFIPDNLLQILRKYDHNQFYYIGSLSESHLQNIFFSYSMAYGGGGFAISYPLAKALYQIQDRCIHRYAGLYGSDDRMQACMAELGVPLTKELGFHQYDVYGNLLGLLAAHPVTPLVSLHHLDVVEPIFPNVTRVEALQRLMIPAKLDSAALMQQSICYEKSKGWTISVSWGFAVQIFRGIFSPREIEMPARTFLNWYRRADYTAYAFNTRPVTRNPCQKPFVFYLSKAIFNSTVNQTVSQYMRHRVPHPLCRWRMADPASFDRVEVYKTTDPHMWNRSPRRNCCRVVGSKNATMIIDVGACQEGEFSQVEKR